MCDSISVVFHKQVAFSSLRLALRNWSVVSTFCKRTTVREVQGGEGMRGKDES